MKHTSFLIAAFVAMFFVSCKNSGTTGLPIPKDAAVIVHINASSLSSKLSWNEIKASEWFKDMYHQQEDSFQKKIMDDPANSGVDVKSDFAFFVKKQGNNGYIVFEGNLKDASAFETTLKKMHHGAEAKKDGDLNYMQGGNSNIISWDKSKFIFVADMGFYNSQYSESGKKKSTDDSLKNYAKELYSLSGSNSIESDDRFTSLIKESGDVHFWMNMEQYMAGMSLIMGNKNPMMSMFTGMNDIFKGNFVTGTLSFDDGNITVKFKQYLGEKMAKIQDKYTAKNVTEEQINRIPSQNVIAAVVYNYQPEAQKEFLKATGMDGFINMALGKLNYSLDELMQATKGELVVAVSDLGRTTVQNNTPGNTDTYPKTKTDFKVLFGLAINNKASFDKLIEVAKMQVKDSAKLAKILSTVSYKTTSDWFAISNKPETVDQFLTGANNKLPFAAKISGHPFGAYIDIQKILKSVSPMSGDTVIMNNAINMWQDIVITGGDYKNGAITGEYTVNMVDKKTNSLKQINQLAEKAYEAKKKRDAEWEKNYKSDSTTVVVPPMVDTTYKTNIH